MMGNLHLAKAVEHCLGNLLKGTSNQSPLVETKIFGVTSVCKNTSWGVNDSQSDQIKMRYFWQARNQVTSFRLYLENLKTALQNHKVEKLKTFMVQS